MVNSELTFIKDMFEKISPYYDFLNRFLSLRQDVLWRKAMAKAVATKDYAKILDSAAGTGDVALEIANQKKDKAYIYCMDFSKSMLLIAQKKIKKAGYSNIALTAGDALNPPFPEKTFDAATIAFGIRNINDKIGALKNFHNVLKQGGILLVLELGVPEKGFFSKLYLLYFKKILPLIGRLFSKDSFAYKYLPNSVMNFPNPPDFMELMEKAGFKNIKRTKLTIGMANLFVGYKF
jgi:demethylmenaquinone methyltransferase / 2-methoxy-6-polyprenyl-1,4-benzoquinol methylase